MYALASYFGLGPVHNPEKKLKRIHENPQFKLICLKHLNKQYHTFSFSAEGLLFFGVDEVVDEVERGEKTTEFFDFRDALEPTDFNDGDGEGTDDFAARDC